MNRSAPLDAQDAPTTIGAVKGSAPSSRWWPRAMSVAAAILALMLLGYTALWAVTAFQLRAGVLDWIEARQAEGYRVAHSRIALSGFPGVARVTVSAPAIAAPDGRALGWSWAGGQAAIEASPLQRDTVALRLSGEESVSINVDGKLRTYRGGAEELSLRAHGNRSPQSASLTIRNLAMAAEEPGDVVEIERLSASAEAAAGAPAPKPGLAYTARIEATGIQLPRQLELPLGEAIAGFSAAAMVSGPFPVRSDLPEALARWRESGGAAEFSQLSLRYGPLFLDGSGTASLDADMQPVGTFMARIQGFQKTLSTLASRGLINEQTAARATIALTILSRPAANGGPATLSVPLSLHDRRLSIGPLPLMVVPLIEWPRGPSPRTGQLSPPTATATQ